MDIRLDTDFFQHEKAVKLKRKLGDEGIASLIRLWVDARRYQQDGIFDMIPEEIEERAGWHGPPGAFVDVITHIPTKFLDKIADDKYKLHNWANRQPWSAFHKEKSEISRQNAMARWRKEKVLRKLSSAIKPGQKQHPVPDPISREDMLKVVREIGAGETLTKAAFPNEDTSD